MRQPSTRHRLRLSPLISALFAAASFAAPNDELLKHDEPLLSNVRQLIFDGQRSGEGYFSADGKSLIFQSEREANNPFYQIYTLDLETGDTARVSPGVGKTTCGFLRPGTNEALFASTHLDPHAAEKMKAEIEFRASGKTRRYAWDYDDAMDLFLAPAGGKGDAQRLTDAPGYDAEGSISPDGSKIVFCSLRTAFPLDQLSPDNRKRWVQDPASFGEIYLMNADGTGQTRLTDTPGYDGGPFFSPDGTRIIWRRFDKTGVNDDVFTMKLDGSDVRRLTDFTSMSWAPYFHPSGKYVVFTSNKHGFANFELFLVDAEGKHEPVRVTYTDGFDGLPVFSADGTKLSWTTGRTENGKSQIFIADWDDASAQTAIAASPLRTETKTTQPATASATAPISAKDLRAHVDFLASETLEGRLTGSEGARKASEYLSEQLHAIPDVKPAGDDNTFFQSFDFSAGTKIVANETSLVITSNENSSALELEKDFQPLAFSETGDVSGDVVFAGYGLATPSKDGSAYDSYAGLDVKDKVVLVLRYVPENAEPAQRQELNRYAGLRYKAMLAREHGAKAILVVTGPNSPNAGELVADVNDTSNSSSGIPAASITAEIAERLLIASGKKLKTLQTDLDTINPHAASGFALESATVKLKTKIERQRKPDRNVIAILPPTDGNAATAEYIVVGAHYDHLGRSEVGALSRKGEERQICYGADDNASGTSVVLELARSIAADKTPRKRGIVFCFWSGEEIGLIGSGHFTEQPEVPIKNVAAYVNFDMVGRLRGNQLMLQGVGSSSAWRKMIERRNVAAGFALSLQDDPYLPTDSTSFYTRGVPTLAFFTGSHEDYHRPTDRPDTLNYEGMERIAKFSRAIVLDLSNAERRPDYVKVDRAQQGGSRDALRVYIGSIPDYGTEVAGVKLSGTRGGSPADKAGLISGDVIVEFGGQKIANIYDYTYALDAAKIGKTLDVIVLRDGQRVTLQVTPEARK